MADEGDRAALLAASEEYISLLEEHYPALASRLGREGLKDLVALMQQIAEDEVRQVGQDEIEELGLG